MANADFAARNATDPKEIDRIYSSAQNDIRQYIDGDTGGTPNIRWKDHQRDITNRFVQLSGDIEIATAEKKFELYDRDTKLKHQVMLEEAISSGDEQELVGALGIIESSGLYSPEKISTIKGQAHGAFSKREVMVQEQAIDVSSSRNPDETIRMIDDQISNKQVYWNKVDNDSLKSKRAYAVKMRTERQMEAAQSLHDLGSSYEGMNPEQKMDYINSLRESGAITQNIWQQEYDLIREPRSIDTTPEHIASMLGYQRQLMSSRNNPEALAGILSKAMGEKMPQNMKRELTSLTTELQDPTSKFNSPTFSYINEQVEQVIKRKGLVSGFDAGLWSKIPGGKEHVKDWDDFQSSILEMAEYEVKQEMFDWIRSSEDFPELPKINKKLADVIANVNARYNLTTVQDYIEEISGEGASISAEDFFKEQGLDLE